MPTATPPSIAAGVKNLTDNISQGNYEAALADGAGILVDVVAAVIPFISGGVSVARTAVRAAGKVDDITDAGKGLKNADAIAEGKAYGREMLQQAKERGEKSLENISGGNSTDFLPFFKIAIYYEKDTYNQE